jgi:2-C-methyl-D-erythritol 4-phosphate cytidylyltransferase/2-C-methyl-D-erythritol 2,4-cyclodiphosphate synthase
LPKQYRALLGETVLRRTVRTFAAHPAVASVLAVIHPDDRELCEGALQGLSALQTFGGETRQESVLRGLEALKDARPDLVLIQDAARPLTSHQTIDAVVDALSQHDGAIAAVPVGDSLKRGVATIEASVARERLWRAQTPQGFRYNLILEAHRKAKGRALTDDAAVAEEAGLSVALVMGDEDNIKLTTETDFERAERILLARAGQVRTGSGYDVHRFGPGDHVWLCGVRVAHSHRLVGHSDADVGLHAITDAILGALSAGDIGQHFPPSDEQWRGAPSELFLRKACELVHERQGFIDHIDVTLICEAPKVAPHRTAMIARIAELASLDPSRVSVKATTTEGLGFTGRREGIAAQAIATVRIP